MSGEGGLRSPMVDMARDKDTIKDPGESSRPGQILQEGQQFVPTGRELVLHIASHNTEEAD
jgi:hypothetical protein